MTAEGNATKESTTPSTNTRAQRKPEPQPASYLEFKEQPTRLGQVTKIWKVLSRQNGSWLGVVQWYASWRRYTYQPAGPQALDAACLEEMAQFVGTVTKERKAERQQEREKGEAAVPAAQLEEANPHV